MKGQRFIALWDNARLAVGYGNRIASVSENKARPNHQRRERPR